MTCRGGWPAFDFRLRHPRLAAPVFAIFEGWVWMLLTAGELRNTRDSPTRPATLKLSRFRGRRDSASAEPMLGKPQDILFRNAKVKVAGQRAAGRCDDDLAGGRPGRHSRGHVRVGNNFEGVGFNAVEGDAGCTS